MPTAPLCGWRNNYTFHPPRSSPNDSNNDWIWMWLLGYESRSFLIFKSLPPLPEVVVVVAVVVVVVAVVETS